MQKVDISVRELVDKVQRGELTLPAYPIRQNDVGDDTVQSVSFLETGGHRKNHQ